MSGDGMIEPSKEMIDSSELADIDDECWNCGGEGYTYMCQDEIGCIDPEGGCDLCAARCWVCNRAG